jgi:hypothetical protein
MSVYTYITNTQHIFTCGETRVIFLCAAIRWKVDTGLVNDTTFTASTKHLSRGELPKAGATYTLGRFALLTAVLLNRHLVRRNDVSLWGSPRRSDRSEPSSSQSSSARRNTPERGDASVLPMKKFSSVVKWDKKTV